MTGDRTPRRQSPPLSLLWATAEYARDIAGLHCALFDAGWDEDSIRAMLDHPGSTALIARAGPQTIGFVLSRVAADEAEILSIGVAKSYQRNGVARRLIEGTERAAQRGGAQRLFLDVAADNLPALALYEALGFHEGGRRAGYYSRTNSAPVDALLLSKALGPN